MLKTKEILINKLPVSFYLRNDVVMIAKELLGKILVTNFEGKLTKGRIVETEAYSGRNDKACHANDGLRTKRTEVMYARGGKAYVYLCYGIHHLFNIVTNQEEYADAVLVRALEPMGGLTNMQERTSSPKLTNGPGILSKAMGIKTDHTGIDLMNSAIWVEDGQLEKGERIVETTRVGVDYAEEDADLPWRFYIQNNSWVSKK